MTHARLGIASVVLLLAALGCSRRHAAPEEIARAQSEALALFAKGDAKGAAAGFEKALALDDQDRHGLFGRAGSRLKAGDDAVAAFDAYLAVVKDDPYGLVGLGLAKLRAGDRAAGLAALKKARDSAELDGTGLKEAIAAIEAKPKDAAPSWLPLLDDRMQWIDAGARRAQILRHEIRGLSLTRDVNTFLPAEHEYDAALRLDPDNSTCLLGAGATALRGSRDVAKARAAVEHFLQHEPDSPAGMFCLAIALRHDDQAETVDRAIDLLRRVHEKAPRDQDVVYYLADSLKQKESWSDQPGDESFAMYQLSEHLNPNCPSTHNALKLAYQRRGDEKEAKKHEEAFEFLTSEGNKRRFATKNSFAEWSALIDDRLAKFDGDPALAALPPTPVKFAAPRALSDRTATAFDAADLDGDCDLDVVAAGIGLLRNDGGSFSDATAGSGLESLQNLRAAAIRLADFDNDGHPDVLAVAASGNALFLADGKGGFADVTEASRVNQLGGALDAIAFDYDHEGDVDLLLVVADGERRALRMLRNNYPPQVDPRFEPGKPPIPADQRKVTFTDVTAESSLGAAGPGLVACVSDVDNGNDTDVVALGGSGDGHLLANLRGGQFRESAAATGCLGLHARDLAIADFDSDGWTDLALVDADGKAALARNRGDGTFATPVALPIGDARATSLATIDFDNDGSLDLLFATGAAPVLLRNERTRFVDASVAFGAAAIGRTIPGDLDADGDDDLLALDPAGKLVALSNDGGNAHRRLQVWLEGDKSNRMGIGAKVEVGDGPFFAKREVWRSPLTIGVGDRTKLDSAYVLWTNGVRQPYRDVDLDDPAWMALPQWNRDFSVAREVEPRCGGWRVHQIIRVEGSCPLLYACDGERFHYVTDVLCSAVLGLDIGHHQRAQPNPQDAVRIRGDQLRPQDGKYRLAITEELREITYFDRARLLVVDHPADVELFTDNKFTFPPFPDFALHPARALRPIAKAQDGRGADVTELVAKVDRRYVDSFAKCLPPMQGMAEMHTLTLDLGDVGKAKTIRLFLEGWFNWTDSSVNQALDQDGSWQFTPPMLEVGDGKGGFAAAGMAGIPAGDNKIAIVDLTGKVRPDDPRVRLTTNLQIYWDRIFVALDDDPAPLPYTVTELAATKAELRDRGYSRQFCPDGKEPNDYDYHSVTRANREWYGTFRGRFTRYGDVRELLQDGDDRYVVMHHGDEIALEFDAAQAPPLKDGWARTFVFRSLGWAKDGDHNTSSADRVLPLPFLAMSAYPPPPPERYPDDAAHRRYLEEWNTRTIAPDPLCAAPLHLPPPPPIAQGEHFALTDVTRSSGIDFHHCEGRILVNLEETMGSGCAFGDVDGDGDDDLFLVQGRGPVPVDDDARYHGKLYRNEGGGLFTDVTERSGITQQGSGMAALFADLDDDGDQDLVVTRLGRNLLYRNRGDGTFDDVSATSGIDRDAYNSGVAAGDYDRDGDLDLYVGAYVALDPANRPTEAEGFHRGFVRDDPPSILPAVYPPAPNALFRNDGGLHFSDVTEAAGVADPQGKTLGVLFVDFDLDGWLDLFCANDVTLNNFFRNRAGAAGPAFESLAFDVGLDDPRGGMGAVVADVDDDTDPDLAVTYWQLEPDALYRNNIIRKSERRTRIPTFEDVGVKVGLGKPSIGYVKWGLALDDLDCDGDLDQFVVDGYTSPDYETTTLCLPQPPLLLLGDGKGSFQEVAAAEYGEFFARLQNGRGLATSDVDGDGDLDCVVTENNGDATLLRNDGGNAGHWLKVELRGDGKTSPRDPAGARVVIRAGDRTLTRWLTLGSSYLCGNGKALHFGLGPASRVDEITVYWPDGKVTHHAGADADRTIRLDLSGG